MWLREIAKFFTGRRDDGEGPSNKPSRKRQRTGADAEEEEGEGEPQHVEDTSRTVNEEEDDEEVEDGEDDEDEDEGGDAEIRREEDHVADEVENDQDDETIDVGLSLNLKDNSMTTGSAPDCSICSEPLTIPVYRCHNGHYACSTCCARHGNKWAACSMPIDYICCQGVDQTLESIQLPCQNAKYGCRETLNYRGKNEHEKNCIYVPCLCPHSGCDFVAMYKFVSQHFFLQHLDRVKKFLYDDQFCVNLRFDERVVFLQEQTDNNLFILNNDVELRGHLLHVNYFGPISSNPWFHCIVAAMNQQEWFISTRFAPRHIQEPNVGAPSSGYLLIPFDFFGSSRQQIKVNILITCDFPGRTFWIN